ncbi:MAG TPA: serine hydrolase domain-containing protein [Mucilaginibacter sp.]|nr:serine hydrolase domain-containing protein [Mucilaginibacter sp.]
MKKIFLFSVTTALLVSGCVLSADAQQIAGSASEKTDEYIRLMVLKKPIPGVSVAVLKGGKVVKMQSYGLANIETHSPATSQSVYKLASLSKQFIAAAVMLLQQSSKIDLDSPIKRYLDSLPPAWQSISVRNLLTHTSGLVRDLPDWDPLKVRPLNEDIKAIYSLPLDFAPGTQWDYSNMNYYVLAAIIEKVTGTNWAEWISQHIFIPSGMRHTRTCSMTDLVPNRVSGYEKISTGWKNADIWLVLWPSSAFLSSIADMAKWDSVLFTDKLLTADSKKQMWTAMKLNDGKLTHYGLGWFIDSVNNHLRIHHEGGVPGFRSDFEQYPDDKLSVIVLTNVGSANAERMAQNIAGFFVPALKPVPPKALPDNEPEITIKVKRFINGLQQQSVIDTSTLSKDIAGRYEKNSVHGLADAIRGKIYSITLIGRREKNGRRTYRYRLNYGYDYMDLVIQFDSKNKISGYGIDD